MLGVSTALIDDAETTERNNRNVDEYDEVPGVVGRELGVVTAMLARIVTNVLVLLAVIPRSDTVERLGHGSLLEVSRLDYK